MRSCLDFTACVNTACATNSVNLVRDHPANGLTMSPNGGVDVCTAGVGQSGPAIIPADDAIGIPDLSMRSVVKLAVIADDMTSAEHNTARSIKIGVPRRSRNAA